MTSQSHQEASAHKILIVADPKTRAIDLEEILKDRGYLISSASSGAQALELIGREKFSLVVLDPQAPDIKGLPLCLSLRNKMDDYMPIIILGSKSEIETGLESSQIGADDYLPRPFTAKELLARVKVLVRMRNIQKELDVKLDLVETSYNVWRNVALTDHLTKLFNRHHLEQTLTTEFEGHLRYGHDLSMIFIDLDHFKRVNNEHGHPIGDWLLRRLGDLFAETFRKADTVARYGGEQFVVLMPHCSQEEAGRTADRIRQQVAETNWDSPEGQLSITISIGVAGLPPNRIAQSSELIELAKTALGRAKKDGRNKVVTLGKTEDG